MHGYPAYMAIVSAMLFLVADENGGVCRDLNASNKRKRDDSPTPLTTAATMTPITNGENWGGLYGLNEAERMNE